MDARCNAAGWRDLAARPADPSSLTALAGVDAASLTGAELVDAVVASEKALSLLTGVQMRLLAAFAVPFTAGDPTRLAGRLAKKNCITGDDDPRQVEPYIADAAVSLAAAETAAALRISPVTAGIRVREAQTMTSELTPTREALEHGVIDRAKARVLTEHCQPLTPNHTQAVQELVLPLAGGLTTSELRDVTGQAVITVDPDGALSRHHAAAARRELTLKALPDAMATLTAFLPAPDAVKIFQISDLLATTTGGAHDDTRGIGARRVDALVDIADHLLTHGHLDLTDYLGPRHTNQHTTTPPVPSVQASAAGTQDGPAGSPEHACEAPDGVTEMHNGEIEPDDAAAPPDRAAGSSADVATTAEASSVSPSDTEDASAVPAVPDDPDGSITPIGHAGSAPGNRRRVLTRQGRRPHLSVTIALSTLAGLDDLPGKLQGFGAIPAELARSIATSAGTITALLTDPTTGAVTQAGALTYRPRQHLRDSTAAIHHTCQFPSCRQPAWRCDIDHRQSFNHHHPGKGGQTTQENTGPLCRRHHLYKHHSEWRIHVDPHQLAIHWSSPTGHKYTTNGRRVAAPGLWIHHGGTTMAERMDAITAMGAAAASGRLASTDRDHHTPAPETLSAPTSILEDGLAALLLRTSINTPDVEYDPEHGDSAHHNLAEQGPSDDEPHDEEPPPF